MAKSGVDAMHIERRQSVRQLLLPPVKVARDACRAEQAAVWCDCEWSCVMRWLEKRRFLYMLPFALCLSGLTNTLIGCIEPVGRTYGSTVSPNGELVACVREGAVVLSVSPDHGISLGGKLQVAWGRPGDSLLRRSVAVDHYDAVHSPAPWIESRDVVLGFSPDSRNLAAIVRGRLLSIELETSEKTELSADGEQVTSFFWLSKDELAYAADPKSRKFFQISLNDLHGSKTLLAGQGGSVPEEGHFPYEFWSPAGRFVVFLGGPLELRILEIGSASTMKYTIPYAESLSVTWEGESEAICRIYYADRCPKLVLRINLASGERTDVGQDPDCK